MKKRNNIINLMVLILLAITSINALGNSPVDEIPFEYEMAKIILPVSINGSKTIRCILDTGMVEGVFLMNPGAAKGLNLEYVSTNVMLRGAGSDGSASASMAMGAKFTLANIPFENQRVIVLNNAGPLSKYGVEGVIGASIFQKFVVQIDIEKKVIRLYEPAEFNSKEAGEKLDLTLTRTKPYINVTVNIDGKKDVPVKLVVDSGASLALVISENQKKGIVSPSKSIDVTGRGVSGEMRTKAARAGKLSLGKYHLNNLIAQFSADETPGGADGLIGMLALERFLVTFDYPGKRMFLKPNGDYENAFEFSMIGISLQPDEKGKLDVANVFGNSPASQAGIQKGDTIISINEKVLNIVDYAKLNRILKTPGQKIAIEIERNGVRQTKALELRRLL